MNVTLWDRLRTLFDFTPHLGTLDKQDDIGFMPAGSPFERMERRAAVHGICIHDLRQMPRKGRGEARGTRDIRTVDTLMFHQMAATINDPERCLGIPSHGAVLRGGDIVLLHPVRSYLWHGHAANRFSIGIEIAARAAGIDGDPNTFWRSKREREMGLTYDDLGAEATPVQIEAANIMADYYTEEVARQRGQIDYVMDHRNSHKSRVSDPGSRIHKHVTLATRKRCTLQHRDPVGSGKPNPTTWSGKPGEPYSWKVPALGGGQ